IKNMLLYIIVLLIILVSNSQNSALIFDNPSLFFKISIKFTLFLNIYILYILYSVGVLKNLVSLRTVRFQIIRIFENTGGMNAFLNVSLFLFCISFFVFFIGYKELERRYIFYAIFNSTFFVFFTF